MRKSDENDFPAAAPNCLHSCNNVVKALFDCLVHFGEEHLLWNVGRRRRHGEKWNPDLLDPFSEFAARLSTFFPHARASFAVDGLEIRRQPGRYERAESIRNGQLTEQSFKAQVVRFQKSHVLLKKNPEVLARALRRRLGVESFHRFLAALERRRSRRREK